MELAVSAKTCNRTVVAVGHCKPLLNVTESDVRGRRVRGMHALDVHQTGVVGHARALLCYDEDAAPIKSITCPPTLKHEYKS